MNRSAGLYIFLTVLVAALAVLWRLMRSARRRIEQIPLVSTDDRDKSEHGVGRDIRGRLVAAGLVKASQAAQMSEREIAFLAATAGPVLEELPPRGSAAQARKGAPLRPEAPERRVNAPPPSSHHTE